MPLWYEEGASYRSRETHSINTSASQLSAGGTESPRTYLVDDTLVDELQVGADVLLIGSGHQQLRANYGQKNRTLFLVCEGESSCDGWLLVHEGSIVPQTHWKHVGFPHRFVHYRRYDTLEATLRSC